MRETDPLFGVFVISEQTDGTEEYTEGFMSQSELQRVYVGGGMNKIFPPAVVFIEEGRNYRLTRGIVPIKNVLAEFSYKHEPYEDN